MKASARIKVAVVLLAALTCLPGTGWSDDVRIVLPDTGDCFIIEQGGAVRFTSCGDGAVSVPTGNLEMNGNRIVGVGDPAEAQEAATRSYVDGAVGAAGGVPVGYMILGSTTTSPPGYSWVGTLSNPEAWATRAAMPTARSSLAAAQAWDRIYAIGGRTIFGPSAANEEYYPGATFYVHRRD
jgi:hypothetical protein